MGSSANTTSVGAPSGGDQAKEDIVNRERTNLNTALENYLNSLASSSETARSSTCWASTLLCTPEIAAKSLIRSRPR